MERDHDAVTTALDSIGRALSTGDATGVAAFWDVPGLVLADQGARAIATKEEIVAFFAEAIRTYRAKGTPTARPDLMSVDWLTDRLAAVSVEWLALDTDGVVRSRESSCYIVRIGDDGVARIHVAMPRLAGGDAVA
jgi:hypothetical protein